MAGERFEVRIGAPVLATDGLVGHIQQVVINPGDRRITALVVRQGRLRRRQIVVPVEAIAEANDDGVRLNCSSRQFLAQPPYRPEEYHTARFTIAGYSIGEALFSLFGKRWASGRAREGMVGANAVLAGQKVYSRDGLVGKVELLFLDSDTKQVSHVVIRRKDYCVIVPIEWVAEFEQERLVLNVQQEALSALPEYHPDRDLRERVEGALLADRTIRSGVLEETALLVRVHDGVVTLRGYVRHRPQYQRIERIVARVPGVQQIKNRLVVDDELETLVAQRIARDPRLEGYKIHVQSWFGYVYLYGEVPTVALHDAAEEVAATLPQVRAVVNRIQVNGRLLAPVSPPPEVVVGHTIYDATIDREIGRVERVVIDSKLRRVTAVVAHVEADALENEDDLDLDPVPWVRHIVIPIEDVTTATIAGAFLRLAAQEVAKLEEFDQNDYCEPDEQWEPPFPYMLEDVVLECA